MHIEDAVTVLLIIHVVEASGVALDIPDAADRKRLRILEGRRRTRLLQLICQRARRALENPGVEGAGGQGKVWTTYLSNPLIPKYSSAISVG